MFNNWWQRLRKKFTAWLTYEPPQSGISPSDFNRLKYEIRPGDVLLVEGHSRVSSFIRTITQSSWTHAALYIGRIIDFEDEELQNILRKHTNAKDNIRLIIEGLLDQGIVIQPLSVYRYNHIRICRPRGISPADLQQVLAYAIRSVGKPYNVRQLFDLARFLLPWSILPRRWGSSLFKTPSGQPESGICSTLLAEAFSSVQFPILPYMRPLDEDGHIELIPRNPYLFAPKDFDYSPYFEIIKYPLFNPEEPLPYYRRLPWTKMGLQHDDGGIFSASKKRLKVFGKKTEPNKPDKEE